MFRVNWIITATDWMSFRVGSMKLSATTELESIDAKELAGMFMARVFFVDGESQMCPKPVPFQKDESDRVDSFQSSFSQGSWIDILSFIELWASEVGLGGILLHKSGYVIQYMPFLEGDDLQFTIVGENIIIRTFSVVDQGLGIVVRKVDFAEGMKSSLLGLLSEMAARAPMMLRLEQVHHAVRHLGIA